LKGKRRITGQKERVADAVCQGFSYKIFPLAGGEGLMRRLRVWDCFAFARTLTKNRLLHLNALRTDFDQQLRKIDWCLCHIVLVHVLQSD